MFVTDNCLAGSLDSTARAPAEVVGAIYQKTGPLPQLHLDYEPEIRTLWVTLAPEPKPVFTLPLVTSAKKVQDAVTALWSRAEFSPVLFIAMRARGPIFSLGGDLDFYLDCLAKGDRAGLAEYARIAASVLLHNATGLNGLVVTLATVSGKALGGGIDPARSCNVMLAEESASFGYPEVNFNHFPISAVPVLSRHAGFIEAEEILLSGDVYSAAEFYGKGVLDDVVPDGTGEERIRAYATRTLSTHRARVALFAAFNRRSGDLAAELAESAALWVDHMMSLSPIDISKLQRVAHTQERMLARAWRKPSLTTDYAAAAGNGQK